jgi:protein gp37
VGEHTKIQWTDATANLWWGCTEVHSGCDHCYARVYARAKGKGSAWEGVRYATKGIWANLQKWQRDAARAETPARVFCGSMMDIFEKPMPASDWQGNPLDITTGVIRDRFFRDVVPACPDLQFQLLTKRPGNVTKYVPPGWLEPGGWPPNVIVGASVVDQDTADTLIPQLLRVPGRRFLSVEPLIGPVDLSDVAWRLQDSIGVVRGGVLGNTDGRAFSPRGARGWGINWVIVGGESGPKARSCDLAWVRSVVRECRETRVPCFVKQLGARPFEGVALRLRDPKGGDIEEFPNDLKVRQFPDDEAVADWRPGAKEDVNDG